MKSDCEACFVAREDSQTQLQPDDVLDTIGWRSMRLLLAIFTCSLVWGLNAVSLMTSAFIGIPGANQSMVTLVDEFALHGDRHHWADLATSFFMFGNMIGGCTFTHASDKFGRRPTLLVCMVSQGIAAMLATRATSIQSFTALRFIQGACYTGAGLISWVAAYEHSSRNLRWLTTLLCGLCWVFGYCLVVPLALLSSNWRTMLTLSAAPTMVLAVCCYIFVPETLHHLVSRKRVKDIHQWLEKVADPQDIDVLDLISEPIVKVQKKNSIVEEVVAQKTFILHCLVQLYLWTCDNFIYFGLSFYSTQIAGNHYVNYLLMGIVELPAYICTPFLLDRFGRRFIVSFAHFLAAVCFLAPVLIPVNKWSMLGFWLLGKFSISVSFMSLFVYASEVFPTHIRNVSIGFCSVLSRIGGILSPHISLLKKSDCETSFVASEDSETQLKPDDVLDRIGWRSMRLLLAIFTCSLVWGWNAVSLMSSAFIGIPGTNQSMVTLVDEFELYGDRHHWPDLATSFFMFGNMVGGCTFTHASDKFGRRPTLLVCLISKSIVAILATQATSIQTFTALRFVHGACYTGAGIIAWVAAYEHSSRSMRWLTTLLCGICWVFGYCLVVPLALLSSNWRTMLILSSVGTMVIAVCCYVFVPETLHHLVSRKRVKDIHQWLEKVADSQDIDALDLISEPTVKAQKTTSLVEEVLAHKIFILHCLVQLYLWTCDNFIYFGLSFYSTQIAGNHYVNYLLMGIVELPAYICTPFLLDRFGRRFIVSFTHFLAAVSFLAPVLIPVNKWSILGFWLLGKFSVSVSFMSLYVYASEVFPTHIRNVSIGICSVLSRIGGIISPHISLLAEISPWLPQVVLCSLTTGAGLLTLLLPETNDRPLPSKIGSAQK